MNSMLTSILKSVHMLVLVFWVGGIGFFSIVVAPSIFKVLPREQAGDVVGDIFPKYYLLGYIFSLLALGTAVDIYIREGYWNKLKLLMLGVMLVATFYSGLVVAPKAHAIKQELRSAQTDSERAVLHKHFGSVHARAAFLNFVVLVAGVIVIIITSIEIKTY